MTKGHHTTHIIGGIATHIYGLENVTSSSSVDIVFLLHGRTRSWQDNVPWARRLISLSQSSNPKRSLLAVAFDARNHGDRLVDESKNLGWAQGNDSHGLDMYSIEIGTAQDVKFLITMLPVFLFPEGKTRVENWLVAGVSLGGHETYMVLSDGE
jgi:hypothetical protein